MTTITISIADLRALTAMRPVIANAAHHLGRAAAVEALDRLARESEAAAAPLDEGPLTAWDAVPAPFHCYCGAGAPMTYPRLRSAWYQSA